MNKFDDMMTLLAARDAAFAQVIAVDASFELFNRAWCVAEIAAACRMGMAQHLQVMSGGHLSACEGQLRGLRIEEMQASRPEDVAEILGKIPDKRAFDARLQELIFGGTGLIAAWRALDGQEQMGRVGQWLRWSQLHGGGRRSCWADAAGAPAAAEPCLGEQAAPDGDARISL